MRREKRLSLQQADKSFYEVMNNATFKIILLTTFIKKSRIGIFQLLQPSPSVFVKFALRACIKSAEEQNVSCSIPVVSVSKSEKCATS